MSNIGTGYDLSMMTFSPYGRVFQIEYAAKAVDNSGIIVAIKCKDGIVMGVEKLISSKMLLPDSNRRMHAIHRNSGMYLSISLYGACSTISNITTGNKEKIEIDGFEQEKKVVVIAAINRKQDLDPALLSVIPILKSATEKLLTLSDTASLQGITVIFNRYSQVEMDEVLEESTGT